MLETICIFETANFVLWNALKLWLGPFPSYLVNEVYSMYMSMKLWVMPIIRKQLEPFCLFSIESLLPATKKRA